MESFLFSISHLIEEQIIKKFEEIDKKYDIKETFSKSDANFFKNMLSQLKLLVQLLHKVKHLIFLTRSGSGSGIAVNERNRMV